VLLATAAVVDAWTTAGLNRPLDRSNVVLVDAGAVLK
jgi:hypothetical protein